MPHPQRRLEWIKNGTIMLATATATIPAILVRDPLLESILDATSNPTLLGVAGWTMLGLPMFTLAASLWLRVPGWASYALSLASMIMLPFGVAASFYGRHNHQGRTLARDEFAAAHPAFEHIRPGIVAAIVALTIAFFLLHPLKNQTRKFVSGWRKDLFTDVRGLWRAVARVELLALAATVIWSWL